MQYQYRLVIEYNGQNFCGWQKQPNLRSIQGVLHEALELVLKNKTTVPVASGRTDSGVHAKRQVATFYSEEISIPFERLAVSLSSILRNEIRILRVDQVSLDFHPVRDVVRKQYSYHIHNSLLPPIFCYGTVCHISTLLNLELMRLEAQSLVGTHDFSSFRGTGCGAKSPIRTIESIVITAEGELITITVIGKGFLKQMVRNIVGTLIKIGLGRLSSRLTMVDLLAAKDRRLAGPTAEPQGLFLDSVTYKEGTL